MNILLALIIGSLFGFALHRVGASNPKKITGMLNLTDLHLAKVILFAIGFSSLILFILMSTSLVGNEHLSIKTSHWGVAVGGLIFGIGFAIAGYCPGTSLSAIGEGRRDAIWFVVGGLVGALLFMLVFDYVLDTALLDSLFGGKTTLAETGKTDTQAVAEGVSGLVIAAVVALAFMLLAYVLPSSLARKHK
ncbi:MAG: YeeE/YedE family protein [Proteobacteria bacterium]|nr:YeeE/YedE family protein [Pseudomonadota bacterium]